MTCNTNSRNEHAKLHDQGVHVVGWRVGDWQPQALFEYPKKLQRPLLNYTLHTTVEISARRTFTSTSVAHAHARIVKRSVAGAGATGQLSRVHGADARNKTHAPWRMHVAGIEAHTMPSSHIIIIAVVMIVVIVTASAIIAIAIVFTVRRGTLCIILLIFFLFFVVKQVVKRHQVR
jgi:hypothetical protein